MLPNPEFLRMKNELYIYFLFLLLTYSHGVGSLVTFISTALKAASRVVYVTSCLGPCELLLLDSREVTACLGTCDRCTQGLQALQDVSWLCQGMWISGG